MTAEDAAVPAGNAATTEGAGNKGKSAAGTVLMALAAGQFLMIMSDADLEKAMKDALNPMT